MEFITLKKSNLKVSRLCMGGCPLGGYGWGIVQEDNLIEAVQSAYDSGVNFFDTADTYGLGHSEELLGKALKTVREKVVIASKFGVRVENGRTFYDNSPEWIRTALDASLRRLKTEYIDLYQIHYLDGHTPIGDIVGTLQELQRSGKIRYFGLSNIQMDSMEQIMPYRDAFVSFQDEYSLACRKNEKGIRKLSEKLQLTPLTWGSLGQGILTGKYDKTCHFGADDRRSRDIYVNFHGAKLEKNLEIVECLKKISSRVNCPVSAVAIRFILDYFKESVVLVGAKRKAQVAGNISAMGWNLTDNDMEMLKRVSSEEII